MINFLNLSNFFSDEKMATLLEFQGITNVQCLLACNDPFEILSFDSDDLLDLKKRCMYTWKWVILISFYFYLLLAGTSCIPLSPLYLIKRVKLCLVNKTVKRSLLS